ncbi:hypothetical protein CsatB_004560 [Cannabis sativa]
MGSLGSPKTWVPYLNNKDCSQGFCSLYCPQWCYMISPPPPPLDFPEDNHSSPNFSPLVVAIIGILVSAFLLVSYYTLISKYCGNMDQGRRFREDNNNNNQDDDFEEDHYPSDHEPWHVVTNGLDEALIKSITVCKYNKGDGFIDGTDCSVCLNEFQEEESVRLLPKCNHAFHIQCIDTWLRSHSNCPLCRAQVVCVNASTNPTQLPSLMAETSSSNETIEENPFREIENGVLGRDQNSERSSRVEEFEIGNNGGNVRKTSSLRAFSDLEERHTVIEIRDEIRRSISMDHPGRNRVSIADILNHGNEEVDEEEEEECSIGKNERRKGVSISVRNPVVMKRSFSSGRFFHGRGRNSSVIPI